MNKATQIREQHPDVNVRLFAMWVIDAFNALNNGELPDAATNIRLAADYETRLGELRFENLTFEQAQS